MARKNSLNINNMKWDSTKLRWDFTKPSSGRKDFKLSTKKMEWLSAAKKDPLKWRTNFSKTSYCRNPICRKKLIWKDGSYDFDHKDNNNANNSQNNCYLVCKNCHGKVTVIKKKKVKDRLTGRVVGYKTIKKKVGYKKQSKKKTTKKTTKKKITKRKPTSPLGIQPIKLPKLNF